VENRPDALRGRTLHGEITEVATTATEESTSWMPSGERTFRAYVSLGKLYPKELKVGMRATARIVVDSYQDAVSVPLECVFDREGDKKIVHVRRNGRFVSIPVVLGRASQDRVIVTKGVKAGEVIALRDLGTPTPEGEEAPEAQPTGGPAL
jgi:multidrug efflux pump subunit AcrA (membrane-fusion protein)